MPQPLARLRELPFIYVLFIGLGLWILLYFLLQLTPGTKQQQEPISIAEKKSRFLNAVLPAVESAHQHLLSEYQWALKTAKSHADHPKLKTLRKIYRVQDNQALLAALKPHPKSITLAQAATESAWATSRFYRQANNVFGIWSFNPKEDRLAAGKQRGDKTIYIKKYPSIKASVLDYYKTLARNPAYQQFRQQRLLSDNPFTLLPYLNKYSERGKHYTKELAIIIRSNKFTQYD